MMTPHERERERVLLAKRQQQGARRRPAKWPLGSNKGVAVGVHFGARRLVLGGRNGRPSGELN